jgi:hypothetical protein
MCHRTTGGLPMKTTPDQNKALVLEAFDTLFNKRDYEARCSLQAQFRLGTGS